MNLAPDGSAIRGTRRNSPASVRRRTPFWTASAPCCATSGSSPGNSRTSCVHTEPDHRRTRPVADPSPHSRPDPRFPRGHRGCRRVHAHPLRHAPGRHPGRHTHRSGLLRGAAHTAPSHRIPGHAGQRDAHRRRTSSCGRSSARPPRTRRQPAPGRRLPLRPLQRRRPRLLRTRRRTRGDHRRRTRCTSRVHRTALRTRSTRRPRRRARRSRPGADAGSTPRPLRRRRSDARPRTHPRDTVPGQPACRGTAGPLDDPACHGMASAGRPCETARQPTKPRMATVQDNVTGSRPRSSRRAPGSSVGPPPCAYLVHARLRQESRAVSPTGITV